MEIGGSFEFWAVLLGAAVMLLLAVSVRRAGAGELLVVLRGDLVARSRAHGWAVRLPALERFVTLTTGPQTVPLVARGTTRDGTDVVVLADLTLEIDAVADAAPYEDPVLHAVRAAEDALGEAVARLDVAGLGSLVAGSPEGAGSHRHAPLRRLLDGVRGAVGPGTRLTGLVVTEVEARLTGPAAAALGRGEAM